MTMSGSGPQQLLVPRSKERDNFFTLCTLLIDGGTRVLRDVLDHHLPPPELEEELTNAQVKQALCAATPRNSEQWKMMYPPSALCGKSKDFDIAVLFKILSTLVFQDMDLNRNKLPSGHDQRPVADLVRIRYYRNQVYAHTVEMKICDEEFAVAWNDISQALIRLETKIDCTKGEEWKKAISLCFESSQAECQRHMYQLQQWCCNEMEVEEVTRTSSPYVNDNEVEIRISPEYPTHRSSESKQQTRLSTENCAQVCRPVMQMAAPGHNMGSETAKVTGPNCSSARGCCSGRFAPTDNPSASNASTVTFSEYKALMKHITMEYLSNNPRLPSHKDLRQAIEETFNLVLVHEREGCLAIRVRCLSLEILQALWEDSKGEKKLKEAAEKCLVTEDVKRQFGIEEFELKVEISEEEYKACRRKLIVRALKTFNLDLIKKIEKHIDDGRFQDGLALMKESSPNVPEEVPAVVKSLMQEQQDINICNKFGQTPLHIAAVKGDTAVAEILLLRGADANKTDMYGRTPLHIASWYGHMEFVRVLLDCRPQLNLDYQDKFGETALNKAAEQRRITVSILLERAGANTLFHVPSLRSLSLEGLTKRHNGYNHVHGLCIEGRYKEIKHLLLNHSLREDMLDDCRTSREVAEFPDMSPLEIVNTLAEKSRQHREILNDMKEVKKRYTDMPSLHQAIQKCHSDEVIALLLDSGLSVDATTGNEESALYLASAVGSAKVMEILLSFGADLNAKTNGGTTPLMIASALQNFACVKLLLKEGADVNAKDSKGFTVLHNTADKGDTEMMEQLLSETNHPNVECTNVYGYTPLHFAAQNGHLKTADILLTKGADPNAQTKQCLRERIYMVQSRLKSEDIWIYVFIRKHVLELWEKELNGHENANVMLSEFGEVLLAGNGERPPKFLRNEVEGRPWVLDNKDETPLILAVRSGNEDMVRLLLKNGANVGTCDAESLTPLHLAAIKGNTATAMLLVQEGADINAVSSGFTPLNLAEFNHNSEVALYLQSIPSKEEREEPQKRSMESIPLNIPDKELRLLTERFAGDLLHNIAVAQARINVIVYYHLNTPAALPPQIQLAMGMATT